MQEKQVMECALAASLCTMILGLTNENALAQYPGFGPAGLHAVFVLVLMNLERCQRVRIQCDVLVAKQQVIVKLQVF